MSRIVTSFSLGRVVGPRAVILTTKNTTSLSAVCLLYPTRWQLPTSPSRIFETSPEENAWVHFQMTIACQPRRQPPFLPKRQPLHPSSRCCAKTMLPFDSKTTRIEIVTGWVEDQASDATGPGTRNPSNSTAPSPAMSVMMAMATMKHASTIQRFDSNTRTSKPASGSLEHHHVVVENFGRPENSGNTARKHATSASRSFI